VPPGSPAQPPNGGPDPSSDDPGSGLPGRDGHVPAAEPPDQAARPSDAASSAVDLSDPEHERVRTEDFRSLTERNERLRQEGLDNVKELENGLDPALGVRKPHQRALTTLRYRPDGAVELDLLSFSGTRHDWRPGDETPARPPKGRRIFETSDAPPYSPDGEPAQRSQPRGSDSEPKILEELVRRQLESISGLSRHDVDVAIQRACTSVDKGIKLDGRVYPEGSDGEIIRTRERMEKAIEYLNAAGRRKSEKDGSEYRDVSLHGFRGDLRLVVDLPSGRDIPAKDQVCPSCTNVLLSFKAAFPGIRLEVRNLAQEDLFDVGK
jgi:hypothetical protein